ncbi:unnamed protein product [Psylliodes chrysocephalus]|uniref:THAP-type domain-containing protein n=1 Tax=Psylliodes chrysocephalus TaxID=3402493 RepID=A0A9P0DAI3_9CUCU|nr:unnamed protein product [Psylliodes chrysocephala]
MLYMCCVPGCRGNYSKGPKVRVFGFPNDENLRKKWLKVIPRDNLQPNKNTKVCELHFAEGNIIWQISKQDSKTGKIVTTNLERPRLKEGCVPTIFPNCPKYLTTQTASVRKSRDEKLKNLDEQYLFQAIEENKKHFSDHKKANSFINFQDFLCYFKTFDLQKGWFSLSNQNNITLFKLEHKPGPCISWSIVIDEQLNVKTFLYSESISITIDNIAPALKTPFISSSLEEIKQLLNVIDTSTTIPLDIDTNTTSDNTDCNTVKGSTPQSSEKFKNIIKFVINMIENVKDFISDSSEHKIAKNIVSEQLTLLISPKQRYRYLPDTMILCSILYTISPHSYKYLRDYGPLILPYPQTIKGVCNKYLTDPHIDERNTFLTYARNVFQCLTEKDKYL